MQSSILDLLPTRDLGPNRQSQGVLKAESVPFTALKGVEDSIQELLASWQRGKQLLQRRRWHRMQFNKRVQLVPLHEITEEFVGEPRQVTGKDVSLFGVSFFHANPLPFGKVALAFELPNGFSELLVTRLNWCRFTGNGGYQSGGKFLRQFVLPGEGEPLCWESLPPG